MKKAKQQPSPKSFSATSYDPGLIEKKWQKYWEENNVFSPDMDKALRQVFDSEVAQTRGAQRKPFYNLMMFPYPSAEGMHVGNMYAFTGADVYGRFMRMQGNDVFEPIGLDGFGIHSENYAFKTGRHPMDQAEVSEKNFYRQLRATGNSYDWTRTVETYKPNYYHWTQWLFTQMFKAGLAYRKKAEVNWCPSCKTVLADEQVIDARPPGTSSAGDVGRGKCERCSSVVERRQLEQWFFRITEYAERLLNNIEKLDWTEKVKIAQRNWIGKKVGINITYEIEETSSSLTGPAASPVANRKITVFTTRPDTNFGATFIVVGPEYSGLEYLVTSEQKKEVEKYVKWAMSQTDADRIAQGRKKTGVFTGSYAINNLNGKRLPIWISDFVIGTVGTGAVVGVPGHDIRDFEFAQEFGLPVIRVVVASDKDESSIVKKEQVQEEEGVMVNSEFLNGLDIHVAKEKIMDYLVEKGWGERVTTYHLRDWLISRQRYWGPPIPMVYCETCAEKGKSWFTTEEAEKQTKISNFKFQISNSAADAAGWYPVPDDKLPVELPRIEDYKPIGAGTSPLGAHPEFYKTTCPSCGSEARRETDVSDTFLDSAWYFLRYTSTDIENEVFDIDRVKKWLPVDMYIGGAEHSVLHLLYSRFVTMVLKDLGFLNFEEPYKRFFAHGLLVKEGAKMSKSKGNVVIPDEYIQKFGADTVRCYLMFLGPFNQGGDFYDTGIEGMNRFLKRVWRLVNEATLNTIESKTRNDISSSKYQVLSKDLERMMHKTVKEVTRDIENLRYNTAVAHIMEYVNALHAFYTQYKILDTQYCKTLVLLLAPFAPHMTEELYQKVSEETQETKGTKGKSASGSYVSVISIHNQLWPTFDPKMLVESVVKIVVQVNGKVRDIIEVESGKLKAKNEIETIVRTSEKVRKYIEGKTVRDVVYVEGKIINFVID